MMSEPQSPIDFIIAHFLQRKANNPNYSLRAFARDIHVSPGQLSKLFNRSRQVTYRQLDRITKVLGTEPGRRDELLRLAILQADPKAKVKASLRRRVKMKELKKEGARTNQVKEYPVERFKLISKWYHLAILELTYLQNFQSNAKWIAQQLSLSKLEVEIAVQDLMKVGLLVESSEGRWVKAQQQVIFKTVKSEPEVVEYEKAMIQKAAHALEATGDSAYQTRLINSITFPVSKKEIPKLKETVLEFQKKIFEIIRTHQFDQVYQMNLQLFPLTRGETA